MLAFPPCLGFRPVTGATPRTQAIGDHLRRRKLAPILRLAAVAVEVTGWRIPISSCRFLRSTPRSSWLVSPTAVKGNISSSRAAESSTPLRELSVGQPPPTHAGDPARARLTAWRGCDCMDRGRLLHVPSVSLRRAVPPVPLSPSFSPERDTGTAETVPPRV